VGSIGRFAGHIQQIEVERRQPELWPSAQTAGRACLCTRPFQHIAGVGGRDVHADQESQE
jgi:hypothetical protein